MHRISKFKITYFLIFSVCVAVIVQLSVTVINQKNEHEKQVTDLKNTFEERLYLAGQEKAWFKWYHE